MLFYSKDELEQAIADKLNEIADLFGNYGGFDASDMNLGISKENVYAFIIDKNNPDGPRPLDFWRERKRRHANRMFTPELGELIGKTAKECLMHNDDNPLCWASDEGVDLMRQKLVFRLQEHDFLLDLKESNTVVTIEKVGDPE